MKNNEDFNVSFDHALLDQYLQQHLNKLRTMEDATKFVMEHTDDLAAAINHFGRLTRADKEPLIKALAFACSVAVNLNQKYHFTEGEEEE